MSIKGFRMFLKKVALSRYAMNDSYAFIFSNIQKLQYAFKAFKQETFIIERRPHGACKRYCHPLVIPLISACTIQWNHYSDLCIFLVRFLNIVCLELFWRKKKWTWTRLLAPQSTFIHNTFIPGQI